MFNRTDRNVLFMKEGIAGNERTIRPGKDPHLGAKLLELLPIVYGEKGRRVVSYFSYFRWVDDIVDESTLSSREKMAFLERQFNIVHGVLPEEPYPMENVLVKAANPEFPYAADLRGKTEEVLQSFVDDVQHSTFLPRKEQELRVYNARSLLTCLEAVGIIMNGRPIKTSEGFYELANAWNNVGTLLHLKEDLSQGLIRVFLSDAECAIIEGIQNPEERKKQFTLLMTRDRFIKNRNSCASIIIKDIPSILDLDIPVWQKIIAIAYMFKVAVKTRLFMKYPNLHDN